jgi:hypothetical protein
MWWSRKRIGHGSSQPGQTSIRVYLDQEVDAARVVVSDEPIARTIRAEGIGFVDLDARDNIVAIELFRVSKQIERVKQERESAPRALDEELRDVATRLVEEAKDHVAANA